MDSVILQCVAGPALAVVILLLGSVSIIREGQIGIAVLFGQYNRILRPGINFRIPFVERVLRNISLQDRCAELEFRASTSDQADVHFEARIVYVIADGQEETILKAAFGSVDERSCMQSLIHAVEGSIRAYVAGKRQGELVGLVGEIAAELDAHVEHALQDWGFHLVDLQFHEVRVDERGWSGAESNIARRSPNFGAPAQTSEPQWNVV